MPKKRYTAERIIGLLQQAEVALAQGRTVEETCRWLEVPEATFYRRRSEYGGLRWTRRAGLRSDHRPEFVAREVRGWLGRHGVTTLFIKPGSPREHGCDERFSGKLRGESLDRGIYYSLRG